jgi:hypothetical protein
MKTSLKKLETLAINRLRKVFITFIIIIVGMSCNPNSKEKIIIFDYRENAIKSEQEKPLSELTDTLKNIIIKAEEFCHWYVDIKDKLNKDEIITYNDSLDYYQFHEKIAESYIKQIKNSNIIAPGTIEILKERLADLKNKINSEKITDKNNSFITDFTDYDTFYNNYETDVPNNNNTQDLKPDIIKIYDGLIDVWFKSSINVCLIHEKGDWFVTFAS